MNRTLPSAMTALQPPVWKPNGSSFGPQLFVCHVHVLGPPVGVPLLLMAASLLPVELLGPEMPLVAASASAQANTRRALAAGLDIALLGEFIADSRPLEALAPNVATEG